MKILSGIMLTLIIGFMGLQLLQSSTHAHGQHHQAGCAAVAADDTICPTNLSEQIAAWKAVFMAVVPLLLGVLLGVVLRPLRRTFWLQHHDAVWALQSYCLTAVPTLLRQQLERTYTYAVRSHQELFANGILHPKLY